MADKLSYKFNPFKLTGIDVPKDKREDALAEIKDYIKEQALSYIGEGKTPVANGKWKRSLSPEYKQKKSTQSSVGYSNLELSGELLDNYETSIDGNSIITEVVGGSDIQAKAEGNQIGSYGRKPNSKNAREFIPTKGRSFRKEIIQGVKDILKSYGENND